MLNQVQQIFEQVKKAKNILITFSANWSGDSLSSALAFYLFLKKIGKKAEIVSSKTESGALFEAKGKIFSFLPAFNEIKRTLKDTNNFVISLDTTNTKIKGIKYRVEESAVKFIVSPQRGNFLPADIKIEAENNKYDLIISLNTPDLNSLGELFRNNTKLFYETPIINIDQHSSNEEYGQINIVKINAAATAEILFSLFNTCEEKAIDGDIATCLLAGIISKTKNFKTANITPDTLLTTSSLINSKARREEIVNKLYHSRNINVLKLWGIILSRLSSLNNGQFLWSIATNNDFLKTGTTKNDLNDIIDELITNIPEAKIIIIFYEKINENGEISASFIAHSPKNIDLMDLMKEHNPRGDEKTVEIESLKKLEELKEEIISLIDRKIGLYKC